eukprot:TRINITY_DN433_c0_g1_i7.p1 TRINITY_DN433_c0_g1~~TRINITY_DN433_c0_g1_i7.p1  ORF type:complete len:293 (-),score=140.44 TRINITY_DN433_c0_g1_i7:22-900(-)
MSALRLLQQYHSDSDKDSDKDSDRESDYENENEKEKEHASRPAVDIAPHVTTLAADHFASSHTVIDPNPAYSSTVAPLCGPLHPRRKDDTVAVLNRGDNIFLCNATKTLTGNIEETYVNDAAFYEQYHTFMKHGYAYDPSQARLIGDVKKAQENKGATIFSDLPGQKRKRNRGGAPGSGEFVGPWGATNDEQEQDREILIMQSERREALEKEKAEKEAKEKEEKEAKEKAEKEAKEKAEKEAKEKEEKEAKEKAEKAEKEAKEKAEKEEKEKKEKEAKEKEEKEKAEKEAKE